MPPHSWIARIAARLRAANPYVVDTALAALVLFAVSPQWLFGIWPARWAPRGWAP